MHVTVTWCLRTIFWVLCKQSGGLQQVCSIFLPIFGIQTTCFFFRYSAFKRHAFSSDIRHLNDMRYSSFKRHTFSSHMRQTTCFFLRVFHVRCDGVCLLLLPGVVHNPWGRNIAHRHKVSYTTYTNKAIRDGKYLARHMPVLGNVHPIKIENVDIFSWRHFSARSSCYIINWYGSSFYCFSW